MNEIEVPNIPTLNQNLTRRRREPFNPSQPAINIPNISQLHKLRRDINRLSKTLSSLGIPVSPKRKNPHIPQAAGSASR